MHTAYVATEALADIASRESSRRIATLTSGSAMTSIATRDIADWRPQVSAAVTDQLAAILEAGGVLALPRLAFHFEPDELRFLDPRWSDGRAKNISLDGTAIKGASGSD